MTRSEILSIAKPILFNTQMVIAIDKGIKKQTRRVAGDIPKIESCEKHIFIRDDFCGGGYTGYDCEKCGFGVSFPHMRYPIGSSFLRPRYNEGDYLYVRETWCVNNGYPAAFGFDVAYKASPKINSCMFDSAERYNKFCKFEDKPNWQPALFMPKEAARIFLKVTKVRLEPLKDIITGDYMTPVNINREGVYEACSNCKYVNGECADYIKDGMCGLVREFRQVWNSTINIKDISIFGWEANPWVWIYEFEKIDIE